MMAADSLYVAVHCIVPSGMSTFCIGGCRCACSACADPAAQTLHLAQPPTVQASCLERAEPMALAAFVVVLTACRAATPGVPRSNTTPPLPSASARGKGGRQDKRERHMSARKASLHVGERGTRQYGRRAARGASFAPILACPRASHDWLRCYYGYGFLWSRP